MEWYPQGKMQKILGKGCFMKLVNIRGTNGSGKTTIPRMLISRSKRVKLVDVPFEGTNAVLTVLEDLKWVLVGKYSNRNGGLDTIKSTSAIKNTVRVAVNDYPGYNIIMEGILCSTVVSTYVELFQELQSDDLEVVILGLTTPPEVCIERVYERNGGKTFNEVLVYNKYKSVMRGLGKFKAAGFKLWRVDNSKYTPEEFTRKFLKMVSKV